MNRIDESPRKTTASSIRYAFHDSILGKMLAVATDAGLCDLRFCAGISSSRLLQELRQRYPHAELTEDPKTLGPILKKLDQVLAGKLPADSLPLAPVGSPFQQRVWRELVKVGWGQTVSYSDLARKAGNPRAVRAVASACARNPLVVIVPCHRVLRKDGSLGGYYYGLAKKRELLAREI